MTPLVLVHGFMGGSAQWEGQRAGLANCCEVIALDLPGFGLNADLPPIDSIGGFADWVLAELDSREVHKFHLLGHSMGGMIVQEMAHRVPDRIDRLILYATGSVGVLPGRFETIAQSKARARADGAAATARRIAANWFLKSEASPGYAACAAIAEHAGLEAILAGLSAMESWSGQARLPEIAPETLVIWGDRDRTYRWPQVERLWQEIRRTSLSVFADCGHAVHLEDPDGFNHVLIRYLT
ncbi:alpha/beta hydrolase [uncultured Roseobacter sp.]|uniref:alpha/beta fold hydrolase n=1 Tax=uncultured Roseobacter sp. TaxID=114847 RepID=UPI00263104FF|nr:alpha/beta hydrolase [uncultured Roseobacter sp.]